MKGQPIDRSSWSPAWEQFLAGRQKILDEYRKALAATRQHPVKVHHGVVAEAFVRSWLESFLPKRFGVTAGYIRGQRLSSAFNFSHFDVIVYDQVESPVLWEESNPDKSGSGRMRIIPVEHVCAVVEVKSAFTPRAVKEALDKVDQLSPLMARVDAPDERYPTYLRPNAVVGLFFIELRNENKHDKQVFDELKRVWTVPRVVYGPVILSGEGRAADDTGLIRPTVSDEPLTAMEFENGLLSHLYMSGSAGNQPPYASAILTWSPMHFSEFAFDLLALMKGTYRSGSLSSFHGIDMGKFHGASQHQDDEAGGG